MVRLVGAEDRSWFLACAVWLAGAPTRSAGACGGDNPKCCRRCNGPECVILACTKEGGGEWARRQVAQASDVLRMRRVGVGGERGGGRAVVIAELAAGAGMLECGIRMLVQALASSDFVYCWGTSGRAHARAAAIIDTSP